MIALRFLGLMIFLAPFADRRDPFLDCPGAHSCFFFVPDADLAFVLGVLPDAFVPFFQKESFSASKRRTRIP